MTPFFVILLSQGHSRAHKRAGNQPADYSGHCSDQSRGAKRGTSCNSSHPSFTSRMVSFRAENTTLVERTTRMECTRKTSVIALWPFRFEVCLALRVPQLTLSLFTFIALHRCSASCCLLQLCYKGRDISPNLLRLFLEAQRQVVPFSGSTNIGPFHVTSARNP